MPAQPSERDWVARARQAPPICTVGAECEYAGLSPCSRHAAIAGLAVAAFVDGLKMAAGLIDLGVRTDRAAELPEQISFLIAEAEGPRA